MAFTTEPEAKTDRTDVGTSREYDFQVDVTTNSYDVVANDPEPGRKRCCRAFIQLAAGDIDIIDGLGNAQTIPDQGQGYRYEGIEVAEFVNTSVCKKFGVIW